MWCLGEFVGDVWRVFGSIFAVFWRDLGGNNRGKPEGKKRIENRREGGLERQRPLSGNRFVSFVHASGRAGGGARDQPLSGMICTIDVFCSSSSSPRPLCFQNGSVFVRVFLRNSIVLHHG